MIKRFFLIFVLLISLLPCGCTGAVAKPITHTPNKVLIDDTPKVEQPPATKPTTRPTTIPAKPDKKVPTTTATKKDPFQGEFIALLVAFFVIIVLIHFVIRYRDLALRNEKAALIMAREVSAQGDQCLTDRFILAAKNSPVEKKVRQMLERTQGLS